MIKTQLCPASELEDKNWWKKELLLFVVFAAACYWGAELVLDMRRDQTTELIAKKERWIQDFQANEPAVQQFKGLQNEMGLLNRKISALKRITTSKVEKVRPLIALDQLQTLWIEGIWYLSADYQADGTINLQGAANDSLLVGEFMLGMRESMNPETANDDIRTQLGFSAVSIKNAVLSEAGDPAFKDIKSCMLFEINAKHTEKTSELLNMSYAPMPRGQMAQWK